MAVKTKKHFHRNQISKSIYMILFASPTCLSYSTLGFWFNLSLGTCDTEPFNKCILSIHSSFEAIRLQSQLSVADIHTAHKHQMCALVVEMSGIYVVEI